MGKIIQLIGIHNHESELMEDNISSEERAVVLKEQYERTFGKNWKFNVKMLKTKEKK